MTSLVSATVEIDLGGSPVILKCTLDAAVAINAQYQGFINAHNRVVAMDLDAMALIVRLGAGLDAKEAADLRSKIFASGLVGLTVPLGHYIVLLMNGGREPGEG